MGFNSGFKGLIYYEDNMLRILCSRADMFIVVNLGLLYRDMECPTIFSTADQIVLQRIC